MATLPLPAAGVRIAAKLDAAERLANETLRATADLQVSMMDLRIDGDVAPYEGQISVVRVQQAQAQLVEAQNNLAKAHKGLRADFVRLADVPDTNERCPTKGLEASPAAACA